MSAVIFLTSPGFDLASVDILVRAENGDPGVACALGTILIAIALDAMALCRVVVGGDRVTILQA